MCGWEVGRSLNFSRRGRLDIIAHEAVTALSSVVSALLPVSPTPPHQATVSVVPEKVSPTGLGGYVGPAVDPMGDVVGRRIQARLVVTARAGALAGLGAAVQQVSTALLGAGSTSLRGQGILKLGMGEMGPASVAGQGANQVASREVIFSVLFEHLRLPEAGEGVIDQVPLMMEVATTERGGRSIRSGGFGPGSLDTFEVFDDPAANQGGPSDWTYHEEGRWIEQLSNIRGGSFEITPNKPGTYLVLRNTTAIPPLSDFVVSTELETDDIDAIGLVFRWRDVDNFYFLLLDARRDYRMIARKVAGNFEALDPAAVVEVPGFVPGATHSVRLAVQGESFRVHVDGALALEASDDALTGPGRIGFFCRANESARFHRLDVVEL